MVSSGMVEHVSYNLHIS